MNRLISLLSPPGAGKSTQAKILASKHGMVTFSMGQLLRDRNDPSLNSIMAKGEMVPHQITVDILVGRLQKVGTRDVVIDGFPRIMEQVKLLMPALDNVKHNLAVVIHITISREESERRLQARARADDTSQSINERWKIYSTETIKVIDHYRSAGLLREVNGVGTVEEVAARVESALKYAA